MSVRQPRPSRLPPLPAPPRACEDEGSSWLPPVQGPGRSRPPWGQQDSEHPMRSTHREVYRQVPMFRPQPRSDLRPNVREPVPLTKGNLFDAGKSAASLTSRTARKGEHEPLTTAITGTLQGHTAPLDKSMQRWLEKELSKRFGESAQKFMSDQTGSHYRTTTRLAHPPKQCLDRITYVRGRR
eukprot:TRINITY_DN11842_c0_g1_i1.p1 TRINITY_DN11842_c0_g1~~TRINITY_DN11842_c0_g1_i1.p1  ORF type:complete len:203 (+),score=57.76 TRINITY_DN11842_c0_g1_i1:62-610(+)